MVLYPESLNALSGQRDLLTGFFVLFRCVLKRFSARTSDQRHRTSLKHTKGMLAFFLFWFVPPKVNMWKLKQLNVVGHSCL